jgi:hypothetical protein
MSDFLQVTNPLLLELQFLLTSSPVDFDKVESKRRQIYQEIIRWEHFKDPTFKFAIGQEVWFLKHDMVQKGNVRVRQITESFQKLKDEVDYFNRSTDDKLIIAYSLAESKTADPNWLLNETTLFASKQELLESL